MMFWLIIATPLLLMIIFAYLADKKQRKKYDEREIAPTIMVNAQHAAESEALTNIMMDRP